MKNLLNLILFLGLILPNLAFAQPAGGSVGPGPIPNIASRLIENRTFDAATVGTVPRGTMVSLTRTGTIIDKVGPTANLASRVTLSATTSTTSYPIDMTGGAFVVTYTDSTNSSALTAIGCTVSGSTITCGTPVVVSTTTSTNYHAVSLSSSLFSVVYIDTTNSSTQTAKACTLTGTVIACGAAQTTSSSTNTAGSFSLWATSATSYLFVFNDSANSSRLTLVSCSVATTTTSCGTPVQFTTATNNALNTNISVLSSTSFAVAFQDNTNSSKLSLISGTLSGNTISVGSVAQLNTGIASNVYTTVLDSTHFIVQTNLATAVFCLVNGTTVTCGAIVVSLAPGQPALLDQPFTNIYAVDSTHAYHSTGGYFTATGDTSGTFSTTGFNGSLTPSLFLSSSIGISNGTNPATTSSAFFAGGTGSSSQTFSSAPLNSGSLKTIRSTPTSVIQIGSTTGTGQVATIVNIYGQNPNPVGQLGVTTAAGSAGQTVPIITAGIVTGLSGLTQMTGVAVNGDGSLNQNSIGIAVGYALDTTSMLLRKALATATIPQVLTP